MKKILLYKVKLYYYNIKCKVYYIYFLSYNYQKCVIFYFYYIKGRNLFMF